MTAKTRNQLVDQIQSTVNGTGRNLIDLIDLVNPGSAGGAGMVLTLADGLNEASTHVVIAGMTAVDEIIYVKVYTTKASIASQALRAAGDFVPDAGGMMPTANAANNTSNQYEVLWMKRH
jgi:hypothetical protein